MPRIPRIIAQPRAAGRRAVASDFGGGQGTAAVAGAVSKFGDEAYGFAEADLTQRAAVQVAETRTEVNAVVDELSRDGDYGTHLERFDEATKEIVNQRREQVRFPRFRAVFDQETRSVVERARVHVRGNVWKRQVDSALGHLDRAGQLLADQLGEAKDESEKVEIKQQFLMLMEIAERQNLIGAQDRFKREQAFNKEALGSDIREAIREDSAGAVQDLLDGSLGADLPESEIQVWLDRAVKKYEADLRKDDASERRARQAQENVEKQERKAAKSELDRLLDTGDLDTLGTRINDLWDVLSSEDRQFYRKREEAGGGLAGGESNPVTYNTLDDLASRGQAQTADGLFVEDEIEAAYRRDDLNRADRDRLINQLNDRRFGDAEDFLKGSLKVGEAAVGNARFIQQSKSAQALRVFQDWKIAHPKATREEAFDFAERLVRDSAIVDLGDIAIAQLTPTYIVKVGGKFDAVATGQKTWDAWQRGDLDDFEYAEQLGRIDRLERAYQQAAGAGKP